MPKIRVRIWDLNPSRKRVWNLGGYDNSILLKRGDFYDTKERPNRKKQTDNS